MSGKRENLLRNIDDVHVIHIPPIYGSIQGKLYAGHMVLVHSLMEAQTILFESNYNQTVRDAIVGPAHNAVMRSTLALIDASLQENK